MLDDYIYCPGNLKLVIFDDRTRNPGNALGRFYFDPLTDPLETQIDYRRSDLAHFVMCHELGHLVELGVNRSPARIYFRAAFRPWARTVMDSKECKRLQVMQEDATGQALVDVMEMLSLHELWARSFAQFFAESWQDGAVSREFDLWKKTLQGHASLMFWEDFDPIREAIEGVFQAFNLRREAPHFPDFT